MMLNKIIYSKEKRNFILFMFFNFFDKGLTFIIPLALLYLSGDKMLYNEFEYVYSIATVLVIFCSFTLPSYLFYGYKNSIDRKRYVLDFDSLFKFSNLLLLPVFGIALLLSYFKIIEINYVLLSFIVIRVLYLNLTSYLTNYYRLIDRISHVFYYTTISSIIIILSLSILYYFENISLLAVFFVQLIVIAFFMRDVKFNHLKQTIVLIKEAIVFSWPTLLHLFLFMGVNNFAKIYAFNYLTEDEMTVLSFVQRFALIIQLVHSSVLAYFLKKMFMEAHFFNKKIFLLYLVIMVLSLVVIYVGVILFYPYFFKISYTGFNELLLIILLYTLFWSISSYSEFHFSKYGKPIYVLLNVLPAIVFYTVWIIIVQNTLLNLSFGMLFFSIILVFSCYGSLFYNKQKLIKTS